MGLKCKSTDQLKIYLITKSKYPSNGVANIMPKELCSVYVTWLSAVILILLCWIKDAVLVMQLTLS